MEATSNTSRASPVKNDPPSQPMQEEAAKEDGWTEYEHPAKKAKQSKVWDEFENIKGTTTTLNKAKYKHCDPIMGALVKPKCDDVELRRLVMMYIVEDSRLFDTVEKGGFRKMAKGFNPHYKHFSRHTARRELLKMYVKERENVKDFILKAPGRVALTTDNWNNKSTSDEYICITAHFVDSNWHLQKRILRLRCLVPPYDATSLANEIIMFLGQWNLEHKLLTITTDNASYTVPMVNNIKRHVLGKGSLVGAGSFFHIRCCAHIVNLVVQAGLESIADILNSIRNMVKILRSPIRRKKFFDVAEKNFKLLTNKRFRLDTPVRWNSTYMLLDCALYYKDVFIYFGERDFAIRPLAPSRDDWDRVACVHKFLKVFYDVTNMFSASNYPTSNSYILGVWKIEYALMEIAKRPSHFLEDMVYDMKAKFDKYLNEYNLVLSCATILDPRYKVTFLKYCFVKIYGDEGARDRVERVVNTLRMWFEEYRVGASFDGTSQNIGSSSVDVGGNFTSNDSQPEFDDYDTFIAQERAHTQADKSELDFYLEEPNRPRNDDLDILDYWFKTSARYPILSMMARDILTIPVSTVASESAFSIGGKTISPTRSSLSPKTVQALICLRDWMLSLGEGEETNENSSEEDDCEDIDGEDETILL